LERDDRKKILLVDGRPSQEDCFRLVTAGEIYDSPDFVVCEVKSQDLLAELNMKSILDLAPHIMLVSINRPSEIDHKLVGCLRELLPLTPLVILFYKKDYRANEEVAITYGLTYLFRTEAWEKEVVLSLSS